MNNRSLAVRVARRFQGAAPYRTMLQPEKLISYVECGNIGVDDVRKALADEVGPLADMRFTVGLSDAATTTTVPWYGFNERRSLVRGRLVLRIELDDGSIRRPVEIIVDRIDVPRST
jgi:hypothetical protein